MHGHELALATRARESRSSENRALLWRSERPFWRRAGASLAKPKMRQSRELFGDEIFDVVIQSVTDRIEAGHCASGSELDLRDSVFAMLQVLPLLNKSLCSKGRSDARLSALLFYERCRTNTRTGFSHFLEGVPAGLPLFVGVCPVEVSFQAVLDMRPIQCIANRVAHVQDLEKLDRNSRAYKQAALQHALHDLAPGLPPVVHMLVSQQRSVSQCAARDAPCLLVCPVPQRGVQPLVLRRAAKPEAKHRSELRLQLLLGHAVGLRVVRLGPGRILLQRLPRAVRQAACRSHAASRPRRRKLPEAGARACIRELQARSTQKPRLRAAHTHSLQERRPTALGETFQQLKAKYVKMLNCDLGILHAAQHVAESAALRHNKALPGSTANWRSRPVFYVNAIRQVQALFSKSNVRDTILYTVALTNRT